MSSNVAIKPSEPCPRGGFGPLSASLDLASASYTRELSGPLTPLVLDELAPSLAIRPFGRVSPTRSPSKARLLAAGEEVHLLVIQLTQVNRAVLKIMEGERRRWLAEVGAQGASLMVVASEDSLELYSTERDRAKAFRPVLRSLDACVRIAPEIGATRTLSKPGTSAARHLLRRSAGLDSSEVDRCQVMAGLHAAASQAAAAKALDRTLAALVRTAAKVTQRVREETRMGDPATPPELLELETLSAERIAEEELAAWQAGQAERCRAEEQAEQLELHRSKADVAGTFETLELSSQVRLRIED
jgi:hypothetical protein